ncbi:MAG: response regulator transcription factor [Chloroflexota bacterium]|nr:response regulator transcription factor [Chloroflexota bacterium]MDE3193144.1 response regulator transcription factor [Chloroflexota bacterium]
MSDAGRVRILIADDHAMFRAGLIALLATQSDLRLVGEAASAERAIELVATARPDVVLMDIAMPGMGGIEGTRALRAAHPELRVLCLTAHEDPAYFFAVVEVGAAGYILKDASPSELFDAIRAAHRGEAYFSPAVARMLLDEHLRRTSSDGESFDGLSPREREVLTLVAEGHSNKDIAEKLTISVNTVAIHRAHVMQKLDMHDRAELVRYAIKRGLVRV